MVNLCFLDECVSVYVRMYVYMALQAGPFGFAMFQM